MLAPAAPALRTTTHSLAGVSLRVESDDAPLLERVAGTLGAPITDNDPSLVARVRTDGSHAHVVLSGARSWDAADLLLGLASPEFPFARLPDEDGWLRLAFHGDEEPLLAFRGDACRARLDPRWRTAVALFLFHRLLRLRRDALFFHAASVGVGGRGALLVGPKGSGKSTTALALLADGHTLLGDETAGYVPADRALLPMRRPVGIKPGPRAAAVAAAVAGLAPQDDGILRVSAETLGAAPPPVALPLAAIVFLRGFADAPRLTEVAAGRGELAALQPLACSLVDAPAARRVFEMVRLFEGVRVFHFRPGPPDATARTLAPALGRA